MAVSATPRAHEDGPGGAEHPEFNLRILQSLALWVNDTADALREVARAGGASVDDLAGQKQSVWVFQRRHR